METPALNVVLSYLARVPPEERAEKARAVTDMLDTPGWSVYAELLQVRVDTARTLTESWAGVPTYEEMVNQAATLRGLLTAQSIPYAVIESGERATQELRQIVAAERANA